MSEFVAPRTPAQETSARLSMGFACVGHTYSHLFAPIFFTLVPLALEKQLGLSHGETVALIFVGNALFGFAAPIAGWLGDKWSATGMMAIYYLGTGAGMVMAGLAETAFAMGFWLAVTGLFASIYHPVGIAWLVRESVNTGTVLGINGIFGALGAALGAVMTGWLMYAFGWRAAYVLPGAAVIATGVLFVLCLAKGWIIESKTDRKPPPPPASRADIMRVYIILAVTMSCGGIIYNATNPALPKAFALDFAPGGDGILTVSYLVGLVHVASGLMQVAGGRMADTYSAGRVYLITYILQVPALVLFGLAGGGPLVGIAIVMVCLNTASLPAENILIARYTPFHRRALIYGLKFVVAIGIASLGVVLEGFMFDWTGGFLWLFMVLAGFSAIGVGAILMLPADRAERAAAPAE